MATLPYFLNPMAIIIDDGGMKGSGTLADPFVITRAKHFYDIRFATAKYHYALGADVNLASGYPNAPYWLPFDTTDRIASLDGRGCSFKNLKCVYGTPSAFSYGGLFGRHAGLDLVLKNFIIDTAVVEGTTYNAALIGAIQYVPAPYSAYSVVIDKVRIKNATCSGSTAAGLLGNMTTYTTAAVSLTNCSVIDSTITSTNNYAAGLANINGQSPISGYYGPLLISRCKVERTLVMTTGTSGAGGLLGESAGNTLTSTIEECFFSGRVVSSGKSTGGLLGRNYLNRSVTYVNQLNNYAVGELVSSTADTGLGVGGYCGLLSYPKAIKYCYSAMALSIAATAGNFRRAFKGSNDGTLTNCLYDSDIAGVSDLNAIARTTAQMKEALYAGFDPSIWAIDPAINNGYPYLINNPPTGG